MKGNAVAVGGQTGDGEGERDLAILWKRVCAVRWFDEREADLVVARRATAAARAASRVDEVLAASGV